MPLSLADLTADTFEPHRGDVFGAATAEAPMELRLSEIHRFGESARGGGGGAFTLTFVGPAGPHLPQAIYPLTHDTLGTLEIFLVPIGPTDGGNGYEAVFA